MARQGEVAVKEDPMERESRDVKAAQSSVSFFCVAVEAFKTDDSPRGEGWVTNSEVG